MRILPQAPVAYIQAPNNNAINANTLLTSDVVSSSLLPYSNSTTASFGGTISNTAISGFHTISNYPTHFENLNGNNNPDTDDGTGYACELIERDDNVNLTLSSTTTDNNHAVKYSCNQQNNLTTTNITATVGPKTVQQNLLYNNLNQLKSNSGGGGGLGVGKVGLRNDANTDALRTSFNGSNNGNDHDDNEKATFDSAPFHRQIFEGNLNVLVVADKEDNRIETTRQQRIAAPVLNVLEKFNRNCSTAFKVESKVDNIEKVQKVETFTEEDDKDKAEEIDDDDYNDAIIDESEVDDEEIASCSETDEEEEEEAVVNEYVNEQSTTEEVEDEVEDDSTEKQNKVDSGKVLDNKIEKLIGSNNLVGHSNLNETQGEIAVTTTTTGQIVENQNLNQDQGRNRMNIVKLDFDKTPSEEGNEYRQQRRHSSCRLENYQRHQDNSVSSNSAESSPDDSLMDDEEPFSESPSSFASLDSPEPTHYPRGIINPNYPGFQHLAHTLSEHFVNHHLDQDDSDLSEFEVELSVESLDENFSNSPDIDKQSADEGYSNNNNNNNNNSSGNMDDLKSSKMDTTQDVGMNSTDCKEIGDKDTKELSNATEVMSCTKIESNNPKPVTITIASLFATENLCCDLETYLKQFETSSDLKTTLQTLPSPSLVEDATRNCPTPDILIKNDKSSCRTNPATTQNRPDLLRNVSPNTVDEASSGDERKFRMPVPDNIQIETKRPAMDCKDEMSYGITPVDIVGDFGREVEHEFGLIVSGYNSGLIGRGAVASCGEGMLKELSARLDQITDAALSSAKEEIFLNCEFARSARSLISSDHATCDLVKASTPSVHSSQSQQPTDLSCKQSVDSSGEAPLQLPDSDRQNIISADHAPTTVEQTPAAPVSIKNSANITTHHETETAVNDDRSKSISIPTMAVSASSAATITSEKLIPTAIVKPKYQKSSYDERQLPPVGLAYGSIGGDHNSTTRSRHHDQKSSSTRDSTTLGTATIIPSTNLHSGDQRSRKVYPRLTLPVADRSHVKLPKKLIAAGRNISNIIGSDRYLSARKTSGNSESCIAIVTPRKKDKSMESYSSASGPKKPMSVGGVVEKNNNNNLIKYGKTSANNNRKNRSSASFDVYNIETALPVIDLEAIENHLKKAKEEERKRRNDREEIRRRLAMGAEDDYFSKMVNTERPGRKPSLQSRLQNGMNLQICFMNEASSDTESPSSDSETCPKLSKSISNSSNMSRYSSSSSSAQHHPYNSRPLSINIGSSTTSLVANNNNNHTNNNLTANKKFNNRPSTLSLGPPVNDEEDLAEADFFTKQARLQIEARMALAQAKDMAHMQMEIERQKQSISPITEVIRKAMEKVGVPLPPEKRRVSRQMLTDMNIAQLQIVVNDLHNQIERLNEQLVQYLMERDDLHMSQDSMLVDIEDLTRYLGAKEQSKLNEKSTSTIASIDPTAIDFANRNQQTTTITTTATANNGVQSQNKFLRIANLVKK